MNKTTQKLRPDELYREYQDTRDNIPSNIFNNLKDEAGALQHEENIHVILERAKSHTAVPPAYNTAGDEKGGASNGIRNLLDKLSQMLNPVWAGALITAALVTVIGVNSLVPSSAPHYLSNCEQCLSHAMNASALTRSTALGVSISVESRKAAKLGRIHAKLLVSQMAELPQLAEVALTELEKFSSRADDTQLKQIAASKNVNHVIDRLANHSAGQSIVFNAANALFIANVSAREATQHSDLSLNRDQLLDIFTQASDTYSLIEGKNELQKTLSKRLREELKGSLNKVKLNRVIDLTRRAMESLGG